MPARYHTITIYANQPQQKEVVVHRSIKVICWRDASAMPCCLCSVFVVTRQSKAREREGEEREEHPPPTRPSPPPPNPSIHASPSPKGNNAHQTNRIQRREECLQPVCLHVSCSQMSSSSPHQGLTPVSVFLLPSCEAW